MNKIIFLAARNMGLSFLLVSSLVTFLHNSNSKLDSENINHTAHDALEYRENDNKQEAVTHNLHSSHDHSAPQTTYDDTEYLVGLGCDSSHIHERKNGYSESYSEECRSWQVMPLYAPHYKYWIDESSLSPLSIEDRETFIANVDSAAAEWNSTRIADYPLPIVNLTKEPSNGIDVVPVLYDPSLPAGTDGRFNPVPFSYNIRLKDYRGRTPLHEFGHMLGLQDLDMNNDIPVHKVLMGYLGYSGLTYHDIQGLALANFKHSTHDYKKYYLQDGFSYNSVCFYCDITDLELINLRGGSHLADASTCNHTYQEIASAGNRRWQKCTECYKVIESEFIINVLDTESVEIGGVLGNSATITIPNRISERNVIKIADGAFANKTHIASISFEWPSNVTIIGDNAFYNLTNLSQITIPASVDYIGSSAFANCYNLNSILFDSGIGIDRISAYTFQNCNSLFRIVIPRSVKWIGDHAFYNCENLAVVSFPSNSLLELISDYAFQYCTSLSIVRFPSTVTFIGDRAFQYCANLSSSTFVPNSELSILGPWGFQSCSSLTSITIPEEVSVIPEGLFADCLNLASVYFEGPIQSIEQWAFFNCVNLVTIALPESLTTIKDYAFQNCANLMSIVIPSSTVHIWPNAFDGCVNIEIDFENIYQDTLFPQQYGFNNQYNNEPITKTIISNEGFNVVTKRLRTGYINANDGTGRKFLTMSGKAAGQYEAYLEYDFDYSVRSIEYQLALWGPNETLIQNSSIRLEAKDESDIWQIIKTFSAQAMGQNKESLVNYVSKINFSTNSFRFIIQTTHNITSSNNVGRVVVGDVRVDGRHLCNYDSSNAQVPYDDDFHLTYCYCGSSQLMPHLSFTYHAITSGQTYDYNVHKKECSCGHITYEPHTWIQETGLPGMGYVYCSDCFLALVP